MTQRCIDLQLPVGVSQLSAFDRKTKTRKTPHCRHAAMARLFTTADTGLSGSHLWSTTPDIYQSDREENRSGQAGQLARVMSPNDHLALRSNDEYSGSFDVAQVYCQDCNTLVSCLYVCTGCESMAIRSVYAWRNSSIIYSALRAFSKPLQSSRLSKMHSAEMHGATVLRSR